MHRAILGLLLLLSLAVIATSNAKESSAPPASRPAIEWDYQVVSNNGPLQDAQLNTLGDDGWELAAMCQDMNNVFVTTFKRPKDDVDYARSKLQTKQSLERSGESEDSSRLRRRSP